MFRTKLKRLAVQGHGAVSDLSLISDLSQKLKHGLWKVKSQVKSETAPHPWSNFYLNLNIDTICKEICKKLVVLAKSCWSFGRRTGLSLKHCQGTFWHSNKSSCRWWCGIENAKKPLPEAMMMIMIRSLIDSVMLHFVGIVLFISNFSSACFFILASCLLVLTGFASQNANVVICTGQYKHVYVLNWFEETRHMCILFHFFYVKMY